MAKTAIIIDDEKHICTFINFLAKSLGIEMLGQASTGKEGLDLFTKTFPDIVILDVNLPDMNGNDVLKKLREKSEQVNIIILSSINNKAKVEELFQSGADHYILKNTGPDEIKKMLSDIVKSIEHAR